MEGWEHDALPVRKVRRGATLPVEPKTENGSRGQVFDRLPQWPWQNC